MRRKAMYTEKMHSVLSYEQAFEEGDIVCTIDVHITDFTDDLMYSDFLPANFRVTYVRYIDVGKMVIEHDCVLPLPANYC